MPHRAAIPPGSGSGPVPTPGPGIGAAWFLKRTAESLLCLLLGSALGVWAIRAWSQGRSAPAPAAPTTTETGAVGAAIQAAQSPGKSTPVPRLAPAASPPAGDAPKGGPRTDPATTRWIQVPAEMVQHASGMCLSHLAALSALDQDRTFIGQLGNVLNLTKEEKARLQPILWRALLDWAAARSSGLRRVDAITYAAPGDRARLQAAAARLDADVRALLGPVRGGLFAALTARDQQDMFHDPEPRLISRTSPSGDTLAMHTSPTYQGHPGNHAVTWALKPAAPSPVLQYFLKAIQAREGR